MKHLNTYFTTYHAGNFALTDIVEKTTRNGNFEVSIIDKHKSLIRFCFEDEVCPEFWLDIKLSHSNSLKEDAEKFLKLQLL